MNPMMLHRLSRLADANRRPFLAFLLWALCGAGCGEAPRTLQMTLLCTPKVSLPNGVSFVFKSEEARTLKPVTDLLTAKMAIDDGAVGTEQVPLLLQRPQQLAVRTLVLLDASASLWTADGSVEQKVKAAVLGFVDKVYAADQRNVIGVYSFAGDSQPRAVYGFSAERDARLSPQTYASLPTAAAQAAALRDAWDKDRQALAAAVQSQYTVQRGASTALYDATQAALMILDKSVSLPPGGTGKQPLRALSLMVFTDGTDEVYAGAGQAAQHAARRDQVLQQADAFRKAGENTILVAGIGSDTAVIDHYFLSRLASPGALVEGELDKVSPIFDSFAGQAVAGAQKFYQFNMCSQRRRTPVEAKLRASYPDGTAGYVTFAYDATPFHDPTAQEPCTVEQMDTCDFSR